jgi:ATP-dependent DNA ligase
MYQTSVATGKVKVWNAWLEGNSVVEESGPMDGLMVKKVTVCGLDGDKVLKSLRQKKVKQGYRDTLDTGLSAMLAHEWNHEPLVFPVYVQPKLDGIRCLVYEKDGQTVFQSRNHTFFQSFPHIQSIEGLVLDGELYNHTLEFQEITSMVRKKGHPDLGKLEYHVYDILGEGTFEERLKMLQSVPRFVIRNPVETKLVNSVKEIEAYHASCVLRGYEGIMIRTPSGLYRQTRSKDLLKYKHFKTEEFKVVGHTVGKEGIPVFECAVGDRKFGVMMKSTLEEKKAMLDSVESYYGKWLTVKYQELSKDGVPRFPVGIDFRAGVSDDGSVLSFE